MGVGNSKSLGRKQNIRLGADVLLGTIKFQFRPR